MPSYHSFRKIATHLCLRKSHSCPRDRDPCPPPTLRRNSADSPHRNRAHKLIISSPGREIKYDRDPVGPFANMTTVIPYLCPSLQFRITVAVHQGIDPLRIPAHGALVRQISGILRHIAHMEDGVNLLSLHLIHCGKQCGNARQLTAIVPDAIQAGGDGRLSLQSAAL